jgi:hypothetical protein
VGQTPNSSSTPYLTVADFLTLKDVRVVGELVRDDGTQLTAAQLATDPNLLNILAAASGEIESALMASERYSTVDLSAPNGNSQVFLKDVAAKLAMYELYARRGAPAPPELVVAGYEQAQDRLAKLATGERVLAFAEVEQAGLPDDNFLNAGDIQRISRFTDSCGRIFGLRNDSRRAH